mmetsp:Transcript_6791/g.21873  ORF Transcript_6791/g.21873 Transcript_6791/m.21873 type:complete len:110 (-) Transcript_6791:176-505(-)
MLSSGGTPLSRRPLDAKVENVEVEIEQVKAALGVPSLWTTGATTYVSWSKPELKARLAALETRLEGLQNLLLEERRRANRTVANPVHNETTEVEEQTLLPAGGGKNADN